MKEVDKAWKREWNKHSGDYGDDGEYALSCAFKAGWNASKRHTKKINTPKTLWNTP